jgi:hypothetical protein
MSNAIPMIGKRLVLCLALLLTGLASCPASELYFVDAHSQVDREVDDLGLILRDMDRNGVYRTILAARSDRTPDEVAAFAGDSGGRIVPAIRTKSGAYAANRRGYYDKLDEQDASGQFTAMAEILLYHAQKGDKAEEVDVLASDPRVQYALGIARREGWPFVIHIEFASLHGRHRRQHMQAMEEMLEKFPGQPFCLNHMGQLSLDEVTRLIHDHPNLYFLTAHTNPYIIQRSQEPWTNIFRGRELEPRWKALIVSHPRRFVFALDNVWARHWRDYYDQQMDYWRRAVAGLPEPAASLLAHGNAERLWGLAPRPDTGWTHRLPEPSTLSCREC